MEPGIGSSTDGLGRWHDLRRLMDWANQSLRTHRQMKIEIYSDVVCPWCYIGKRRFERALAEYPDAAEVEVVFRPYQLDPNAPAEAVPQKEYLEQRFGAGAGRMMGQVTSAAAAEGIEIDWDRALAANTRTAHRLLGLARRDHGEKVQRALTDRLFAMHFTRGGNIADIDQLAAEAEAVGMDAARARSYLESDEGVAELDAEFRSARELGVRAVPTFVFNGKWTVEGAQPVATFLKAMEEVASGPQSVRE